MHQRTPARTGLIALAAISALVCGYASASTTPVVALPHGYYLQPDKEAQTILVKRGGGKVLPSPIAAYAVSGNIVAGALGEIDLSSPPCTNDCPFVASSDTRYFVLNTVSGKLDSNLDEAEWRRRLEEEGVSASFRITAPLRWQPG